MKIKKFIAIVLGLSLTMSLSVPGYAIESPQHQMNSENDSQLSARVSYILDNETTTQTITVSEHDYIQSMLDEGAITYSDLNTKLGILSDKTTSELQEIGYNSDQIDIIKNYTKGSDAYSYIHDNLDSRASSAELTFRYGLAGHNDRRGVTIAYHMTWSKCPFWTFPDCFGVGWLAADSASHSLAMSIDSDSIECEAVYYYSAYNKPANIRKTVEINDFSNTVILGYPKMSDGNASYAKTISGVVDINTQSLSNNIDTVQLFVAYGHTTLVFGLDVDVSLGFNITDTAISFTPNVKTSQELIVSDHHTFKYNSTGDITAS